MGARLTTWRWIVVGVLAQIEVVRLATDIRVYWAGDRYLWTITAVTVLVCGTRTVARQPDTLDGRPLDRDSRYAIYLVHTLILYRVYENAVGPLGRTGAVSPSWWSRLCVGGACTGGSRYRRPGG